MEVSPPFDTRNELEAALVAAIQDPADRGPFLRKLLESVVFVVGEVTGPNGEPKPEGETTIGPENRVNVQAAGLPDGRRCLPMYSSPEWLSACVHTDFPGYVALPAVALLNMSQGATVVLNLGAPWSQEFPPDVVQHLVRTGTTGDVFRATEPVRVKIDPPDDEPIALIAALTSVLTRHPEVSEGYVAVAEYPGPAPKGAPKGPHMLVGLDGEGDLDLATDDAGIASQSVPSGGMPTSLLRLSPGDGAISDAMIERGLKFYDRE